MLLALSVLLAFAVGAAVTSLITRSVNRRLSQAAAEHSGSLALELRDHKQQLLARHEQFERQREVLAAANLCITRLQTQLELEEKASAEKIAALQDLEQQLKDSFKVLATEALKDNSDALLRTTRQQWDQHREDTAQQLGKRHDAINALLQPVQKSLDTLSQHTQHLEVKREGAYSALRESVEAIHKSHADLRGETRQLVQALRSPRVRGNWGELQLKRCVEFAGMAQHASFDLQASVVNRDDNTAQRPDLIVHLPNGRAVVVDAKTPLESFLSASSTEDPAEQVRFLAQHASAVREHMKQLSSKAYWKQFAHSPDFVICFLPSEVLFSAALEQDPGLIESGAVTNVLLATPTTLIAMLKAIACGWQQAEVAANARHIQDCAEDAYKKLRGMQKDFQSIGKGLANASAAYNEMLGKVEGRGGVFTLARKLHSYQLGDADIPDTTFEMVKPRQMLADDWQDAEPLALAAADAEATKQ